MKVSCTIRVPSGLQSRGTAHDAAVNTAITAAIQTTSAYCTFALFAGILAIIGGVIMMFFGISGHTSFNTNLSGLNAKVTDAAPGVVLMILGGLIIWRARPEFTIDGDKDPKNRRERERRGNSSGG